MEMKLSFIQTLIVADMKKLSMNVKGWGMAPSLVHVEIRLESSVEIVSLVIQYLH